MEIEVALSTVAEVAMSLAGFTGLLLALAPTGHDKQESYVTLLKAERIPSP